MLLTVFMLFLSFKNCGWDYCYYDTEGSRVAEIVKDQYGYMDALCVTAPGEGMYKIRPHFMEIFKLSSITFFEENVSGLADMEQLRDKEQFILYVVTDDIDAAEVIEEIERYCPQIDRYEVLRESVYTTAYLLSGGQ